MHDPETVTAVGPHEVVWCSGVFYHAPHPLLTLEKEHRLAFHTTVVARVA